MKTETKNKIEKNNAEINESQEFLDLTSSFETGVSNLIFRKLQNHSRMEIDLLLAQLKLNNLPTVDSIVECFWNDFNCKWGENMDYYVKWNGQVQKWFSSLVSAYRWCVDTDNRFPSKHAYSCYYRTGDLQFTRKPNNF